jgi:hypothetical protein
MGRRTGHLIALTLAIVLITLTQTWLSAVSEDLDLSSPEPASPRRTQGRRLCILANRNINESSGLACGMSNLDVLWTHNDSGDTPRVFAFNLKCEDLGTFTVAGADAVDWEDMASFESGSKGYLLIADVGDNTSKRGSYSIYLVEEPLIAPGEPPVSRTIQVAKHMVFTYEDGPHNCEAVAIDPRTEKIYLVSNNAGHQCKVYELPSPQQELVERGVAKVVATLKLPRTTAMDISPDGARAIVLTYGDAYEFARLENETWPEAFSREPRLFTMPFRIQGESICYGRDRRTLYLTSEMVPTPLWEVHLP